MNLLEVRSLTRGERLHHVSEVNADKTPQRWFVSGRVKIWNRDASKVKVPIKHGLYINGYITEENMHLLNRS